MVEAGDVAGAQTFILKELQTEFGNSARAAGETFAGQMDILRNSIDNVKERIGTAFLPILQTLAERANDFLSDPKVQENIEKFATWIEDIAVPAVEDFITKVGEMALDIKTNFQEFQQDTREWADTHKSELDNLGSEWQGLKDDISNLLSALGLDLDENGEKFDIWGLVVGLATWELKRLRGEMQLYTDIANGFRAAADVIKRAIDGITTGFRDAYFAVRDFFNLYNSQSYSPFIPSTPFQLIPGFASGGNFTVPSGFPNDLFRMGVSSGEHVQVTPQGKGSSTGLSTDDINRLAQAIGKEISKRLG